MDVRPKAIYPKDFFAEFRPVKEKTCFVLMPFRPRFAKTYDVIQDVCKAEGFECTRADKIPKPGIIPRQIMEGIQTAAIVLSELTDLNPNVFYELGISHVVRTEDRVVLLTQDVTSAPFDVRHFRHIDYKNSPKGRTILANNLRSTLQTLPSPRKPWVRPEPSISFERI